MVLVKKIVNNADGAHMHITHDGEDADCCFLSGQHVSSGVEGSVCIVEAAVFGPWSPTGHRQMSDQLVPLPALPVSCHHVTITLQPDAGVSR